MAIRMELNPDGIQHWISDGHVVVTGPTNGIVRLPDGTEVDVTPAVIEVADEEQAALVAQAIADMQEA